MSGAGNTGVTEGRRATNGSGDPSFSGDDTQGRWLRATLAI
jgi:hypothetical protein